MNNINITVGYIFALVISTTSLNADAALVSRLNGLAYYDTITDLTWLADANYARTSGYAARNANGAAHSSPTNIQTDGSMGWVAATTWVNALEISGITGWRLPSTLQPDTGCTRQDVHGSHGYGCAGSEMGNLFYNVLGGQAENDIAIVHNDNYDLFSNIPSVLSMWSDTEWTGDHAWSFAFRNGNQRTFNKNVSSFAWAIHDGDVGTMGEVPVPAAAWLLISGIAGLISLAKRASKKGSKKGTEGIFFAQLPTSAAPLL